MFIRTALMVSTLVAALALIAAAVEGQPGWVYAATAAFMVVGVALALHTVLVATRPGGVLTAVGFQPTRRPKTWRAVVAGVPVEAILEDAQVHFRPAGLPVGLSIQPGPASGRGAGAPDFDAVARCRGRSAELAALGPHLRAQIMPLLAIGATIQAGAVTVPAQGSAEVMAAASEAGAALAGALTDLRGALIARAADDPPALALPAILALAAGWPDHPATQAHLEALLADADPTLRLAAAEASPSQAAAVLARLCADADLADALRIRALSAQIGAASSADRRSRLTEALTQSTFEGAALMLASKHGVPLPLDGLTAIAAAGGPNAAAATVGLQMHAEAAEPALIALADHPEPAVRAAALESLARVGAAASAAHLAEDDDPAAQAALARIRQRVGDSDTLGGRGIEA